ncbi:hypothetical protein HK105_201748 [Polyrhizophydium stewartii]|uniref:Copper acquisition factor BIM1-like domain-containing protein n=1 Tax=Polyrhizophydium stewartii TaxID=2732419 RepID=A0ABR4NHI0_9FUNG|nr:hypothetical protein HK105_007117 [Polyrhizophydium stewartii]
MLAPLALLLAAAAAAPAAAHFTVTAPPSRGQDELTQATAPCGGAAFNAAGAASAIQTAGTAAIRQADATATCTINFGLGASPASFVRVGSVNAPRGVVNIPYDLSAVAGLTDGAAGVIQIVCNSSDGTLYSCSDVTVSTVVEQPGAPRPRPAPSSSTGAAAATSSPAAGAAASSTAATAAATTTSSAAAGAATSSAGAAATTSSTAASITPAAVPGPSTGSAGSAASPMVALGVLAVSLAALFMA